MSRPIPTKSLRLVLAGEPGSELSRAESKAQYDEIVAFFSQHPDLTVIIEGHTDSTGVAEANQTLSEQRAAHVRQRLITEFGVDSTRIAGTAGFGSTRPRASNDTPDGRRQNRRVELVKP